MNHYDDRASYFALLNDEGKYIEMHDTNRQADISMTAYGCTQSRVVYSAYLQADV